MSGGGAYLPLFCPVITLGARGVFFRSSLRTQAPGENGKNKFDERETGEPCRTRGHREPCLRDIFLSNPTIAASLARYKTRNKMHENTKLKSLALNELELRKIVHILCFGIR